MDTFQKKPMNSTLFLSVKETRRQGVFLKRIGTLLCEGFSLKEAVGFLFTIADDKQKNWLTSIEKSVYSGHHLHSALIQIGFSERVCTQIYLSTIHGRFSETVRTAGEQLIVSAKRRKRIQAIVQYPIMLILFITIMLFSMRFILMPHIQSIVSPDELLVGVGTRLIISTVYTAPYWIVGLLGFLSISLLLFQFMIKNLTVIEKLNLYCKNKLVSIYIQLYWTQFYAFEWSQLLKSNCSLIEIVHLLQKDETSKLSREVGRHLEQEMRKGESFQEALAGFGFLKSEIGEIVRHSELTGRLGSELMLYASECEEELNQKIENTMEKIQPIVFVVVALMIIAIYAALLLPTFSIMEGL